MKDGVLTEEDIEQANEDYWQHKKYMEINRQKLSLYESLEKAARLVCICKTEKFQTLAICKLQDILNEMDKWK